MTGLKTTELLISFFSTYYGPQLKANHEPNKSKNDPGEEVVACITRVVCCDCGKTLFELSAAGFQFCPYRWKYDDKWEGFESNLLGQAEFTCHVVQLCASSPVISKKTLWEGGKLIPPSCGRN